MSCARPGFFIQENVKAKKSINQMNRDNNVHNGYLTALENLCVGKTEYKLSRTNLSSATQERNEYIPLFATKLISLFNTPFSNETNPNTNILVIDTFVSSLRDECQKNLILQQKKYGSLENRIYLTLKYQTLKSIL